jgi:hypothetical protein
MTSKAFGLAQLGNVYSDGALSSRNKVINGAMVIDQRNAGASYTQVNSAYNLDRWAGNSFDGGAAASKFSVQQSSTAPTGFSTSLLVTSLAATADSASNIFNIEQKIEGFNSADLMFGTANAKTITVSFWVRSSITGTFGGAIKNSARNRAYPFTYTISSADTFEYKTLTIAGDTSGTWVGSTNGSGLWLSFGLGVGSTYSGTANAWGAGDLFSATGATSVVATSGATFYLTGVQLEAGDTATPFEHRSYGQELALCQRYFYMVADGATKALGLGTMFTSTQLQGAIFFPVTMRATPTLSAITGTNYYEFIRNGTSDSFNSLSIGNRTSTTIGEIENNSEVSGTVGHSGFIRTDNAAVKVSFSSEL